MVRILSAPVPVQNLSSGFPPIMPQNPTQSCRADDGSVGRDSFGVANGRINDGSVQALVGALGVVMREVFMNGVTQADLAQRDDPAQALPLQRSEEALHEGIAVRRLRRRTDRAHTRVSEDTAEARTEGAIAVHDAKASSTEKAIEAIG